MSIDLPANPMADEEHRLAERRETIRYGYGRNVRGAPPALHLSTQAFDGVPHMSYYVHPWSLSFVWSGRLDEEIEVSEGGYMEPVSWKFDIRHHTTVEFPIASYIEALAAFRAACDDWLRNEVNIPNTWINTQVLKFDA